MSMPLFYAQTEIYKYNFYKNSLNIPVFFYLLRHNISMHGKYKKITHV